MSSEPVEVLQKRLMAIARGRESARGFHFFCQVGSAEWKNGVTTLQISGTGWTLVGHRPHGDVEGNEQLYSVYISARDLRAFVRSSSTPSGSWTPPAGSAASTRPTSTSASPTPARASRGMSRSGAASATSSPTWPPSSRSSTSSSTPSAKTSYAPSEGPLKPHRDTLR